MVEVNLFIMFPKKHRGQDTKAHIKIEFNHKKRPIKNFIKPNHIFRKKHQRIQKEIGFNTIEELRHANLYLSESVEASLKALEKSLNNLPRDYNIVTDNSVKATVQKFHDIGFFDSLDNKDKIFGSCITFNKRRR